MFKKLKEKITEEVKISPQRFAEFTQSVSDRLQNSTNSDDNFFSIGEDDSANSSATAATTNNDHGFSSVNLVSPTQQESRTRRNSTSSMASDVSFLPRYEPSSMYHLQSDLDISASEVEDNASTASSQLGHLSKEQIYSAFQKSQMRYHKYRGRYTDLSRHYKDLERENSKMKAVLVETQDKAIRRVTELKEQCNLEQRAKAHLDAALRNDIDEKDYKIKALQTKIELLQNESRASSTLTVEENGTDNLENLTNYLNDARKEIESLNAKIQEMKATSIVFQSKEQEYKTKISNMEKEFSEREKENNLKLAQSKMDLHNEILSKDMDLSNLKKENEMLKQSLETDSKPNVKLENLQSQNKKLIEKVEALTQKTNAQESELLKIEVYKMEIQDLKQNEAFLQNELATLERVNSAAHTNLEEAEKRNQELIRENAELAENLSKEKTQLAQLREDAKKGLLSLEPKIKEKLQKEYRQREADLQQEFSKKLEELSSSSDNVKELQLKIMQKDDETNRIAGELAAVKSELAGKLDQYNNLEKNHLELIEDANKLRSEISSLEKDKLALDSCEEKTARLEAHINTLQAEAKACAKETERQLKQLQEQVVESAQEDGLKRKLDDVRRLSDAKEKENVELSKENLELQKTVDCLSGKLRLLEEKLETAEMEDTESKLLEMKVQKLEEEREKMFRDFEIEKKMYEGLLENQKEILEKNNTISLLEDSLASHKMQIVQLESQLSSQKEENICLAKAKLELEKEIVEFEEKIRIFEEREECLSMDKTECAILEIKLQKMEKEKQELLESFELDRANYQKHLEESSREARKTSDMQAEISSLKILLEKGNVEIGQLNSRIKRYEEQYQQAEAEYTGKTAELKAKLKVTNEEICKLRKTMTEKTKSHVDKLNGITAENEKLRKEIEEKDCTVSELSKNLQNLSEVIEKQTVEFNSLLGRTQQLETVLEKMKSDSTEAIRKEKEHQSELTTKIRQLQEELEEKTGQFVDLNSKVSQLETRCLEEKKSHQAKMREMDSLQEKLTELQALETRCQTMGQEQQVVLSELASLKSIENEKMRLETKLKTSEQDLKQCSMQLKVGEQETRILQEEKDVLLGEIEDLRSRIVDIGKDNNALRAELSHKDSSDVKVRQLQSDNEVLATESEKRKREIDELNFRIAQVTSDNRLGAERSQNLLDEAEKLKVQLEQSQTEKEQLAGEHSRLDIAHIQRDFYDIKTKCDELFVENQKLRTEYGELQEKCGSFGGVKSRLEAQIAEMEAHYNEIVREKQLLQDEIEELKTSPVNVQSHPTRLDRLEMLQKEKSSQPENAGRQVQEIEILRDKLTKYKSLDLTNKSSIEFYENELQKTKNMNDKLSRKLDETLVTLNHCAELSTSTEVEYLRNVLYNYMLGKESMVLARVIAAVCKFDAQQTEMILQKEQQKQTLLGQLGLM